MIRNLITGGTGLFGVYLAKQLLVDKEEVVLIQRKGKLPPHAYDLEHKVKVLNGDIGNLSDLVNTLRNEHIDCIYHTAGIRNELCNQDIQTCLKINFNGTLNVLEAARIANVKTVIYTSTIAVYGKNENGLIGDQPPKPDGVYATTKYCSELLGLQYHERYGIDFRAGRYLHTIGPGRPVSYYRGDFSGVIERTASGKPYVIHSDPQLRRACIYVKDAILSLVKLRCANGSDLTQRVYNFQGFVANLHEIAEVIKIYLPDARISYDEDKSDEMRASSGSVIYTFDPTMAFNDLGYKPEYLLKAAVKDFISEVQQVQSRKSMKEKSQDSGSPTMETQLTGE